jgi:hypothetical protein
MSRRTAAWVAWSVCSVGSVLAQNHSRMAERWGVGREMQIDDPLTCMPLRKICLRNFATQAYLAHAWLRCGFGGGGVALWWVITGGNVFRHKQVRLGHEYSECSILSPISEALNQNGFHTLRD